MCPSSTPRNMLGFVMLTSLTEQGMLALDTLLGNVNDLALETS